MLRVQPPPSFPFFAFFILPATPKIHCLLTPQAGDKQSAEGHTVGGEGCVDSLGRKSASSEIGKAAMGRTAELGTLASAEAGGERSAAAIRGSSGACVVDEHKWISVWDF